MENTSIESFFAIKGNYFPEKKIPLLEDLLSTLDERKLSYVLSQFYARPKTALYLSIFLGFLGIDRFYIASRHLGQEKLGLFFIGIIWPFLYFYYPLDWFFIQKSAQKNNITRLFFFLNLDFIQNESIKKEMENLKHKKINKWTQKIYKRGFERFEKKMQKKGLLPIKD